MIGVNTPKDETLQKTYGNAMNVTVEEETLTSAAFIPHVGTMLILPLPPEKITKGGIHLPPTAQMEQPLGHVMAVSEGETRYAVGDLVAFRHTGTTIKLADGTFVVVQRSEDIGDEILGKFKV
jgi:co-chaperonin GroES (HSP10)